MDKNVEAQRIANKYLETEISDFQVHIQSTSTDMIDATKEGFSIELEILKEGFEAQDYSHIEIIIGDLLPENYKLNTKCLNYKILRSALFNARVKAAQEMIKVCEGPYSYSFKGENMDLAIALKEFLIKEPAVNKWKRTNQKKTQILINDLATEILGKYPKTGVTALASEIANDIRMKNSENPIGFETIRKDYLDDFK
jgi:hypothetical protein